MARANAAKSPAPVKAKGEKAKTDRPVTGGEDTGSGPDKEADPVSEAQAEAAQIIADAQEQAAATVATAETAADETMAVADGAAANIVAAAETSVINMGKDAQGKMVSVAPETLHELGQMGTNKTMPSIAPTGKATIMVRAIKRGYYDQIRIPGAIFRIRKMSDMGKWMELVAAKHAAEAKPPAEAGPITGDESVI